VLLVGFDGAERALMSPLMDGGAMPHVRAIVESGCVGTLIARPPHVRAMLWTTLATGVHAPRHGVCGDVEVREDGAGVRPTGHGSWRAPAMWQHLAEAGVRSAVVGWPASAPATSWGGGVMIDDTFCQPLGRQFGAWPLLPDCVAPRTARDVLRSLRVHPADITGLQLQAFVPELSQIDQENDKRLVRIALALSRAATVHAAATHIARDSEWNLCCIVYPLLTDLSREFMRYRPPARSGVPASDVALYSGVVDAAYRFADAMLGTLLDCVERETTVIVVSPYGLAQQGFLAARGASVRVDELVYGVSLVDIGATVMNVFGVRVEACEGRCIEAISTPVRSNRATPVALGIDPSPNEPTEPDDTLIPAQRVAVERASLAWIANAAESYVAAGRFDEAAARYARIVARAPDDWFARARLARCHLQLGHYAECFELAAPLVEQRPSDPWGYLLCAAARVLDGDAAGAKPHLAKAREHGSDQPAIAVRLGMLHLASRDWHAAELCFRESLESNPDSVEAHDGLGCALHAQARYGEAIEAFRAGLGFTYHCALAHAHLAMSLAALRRWDEAAEAALIALDQDPTVPGAREVLERASIARGRRPTSRQTGRVTENVRPRANSRRARRQ
jgi:tetratricopeptide (TPR) repeat protein